MDFIRTYQARSTGNRSLLGGSRVPQIKTQRSKISAELHTAGSTGGRDLFEPAYHQILGDPGISKQVDRHLTKEEKLCEEHYVRTTVRDTSGWYIVKLLIVKRLAKPALQYWHSTVHSNAATITT